VFASIWDEEPKKMLCSFDGANVFVPWHRTGLEEYKTNGGWFHVDQGDSKRGKHCVQGLLTLYDADDSTGGLNVIPGSHLYHDEMMKECPMKSGDFVSIPIDNPILHGTRKLVTGKAGDLILWDSRTIHCSSPALRTPETSTDELLRAVAYICMTPQSLVKD
jgi:ectoine hydroxylase-related dioxygenase (phytanoyl-CoA dioxygenase family)